MKKKSIFSALLIVSGLAYQNTAPARPVASPGATVTDSVGIEKKDGKRFILHRVDEGQTLYAIARRYGRSVAEIMAANPDMKESVRYNQLVRIPIPDGAISRKQEKAIDRAIRKEEKDQQREAQLYQKSIPDAGRSADKENRKTDDPARAGIHVVEPGQTLYSLAVRYGASQSDLRKWNNLPGDNILIGQALIVSEKAYQVRNTSSGPTPKTPDTPSRTAEVRPMEPRPPAPTEPKPDRPRPNRPESRSAPAETPVGTEDARPAPAETKSVEIEPPRPGNDAPMPTRGRRISSSGVAEMIEGDGSGKYLALHRSAPLGTLVQVRNEFNNQSLWVKVIGRLPDTGVNDKILIKLSTQAFAKLSPQDRRFRAEVSYIVR